jgi:hypothetical protein
MQCQAVIIDLCVKYVPKRQGRQDIHTNRATADTTELISKTNVTSFSTLCEFVLSNNKIDISNLEAKRRLSCNILSPLTSTVVWWKYKYRQQKLTMIVGWTISTTEVNKCFIDRLHER